MIGIAVFGISLSPIVSSFVEFGLVVDWCTIGFTVHIRISVDLFVILVIFRVVEKRFQIRKRALQLEDEI